MKILTHLKGPRRSLAIVLSAALLAILGVVILRAQQNVTETPTAEQRAVALLREINTAELSYHDSYQHYGTRMQLLSSKIPQEIEERMKQHAIGRPGAFVPPQDLSLEQPIAGYSLSIYLSPESLHYLVALENNSSEKNPCVWSFYTGDSGVIHQAKPIGCK